MNWREWGVLAAIILVAGFVGGVAGGYVVHKAQADITCD